MALHTCVALHSWQSCGLESTQGCVGTSLHGFSTTEAGLGLTLTPPAALRHGGEQKKGHAVWCHPLSHSSALPYRNAHSESPERSGRGARHQSFFTWDPAPGRERCPQHPPGADPVPLLLPWPWARTAHPGSSLSCQEDQIPEEFWLGVFARARRMRSQGWHREPKSCGNLHWGIKP